MPGGREDRVGREWIEQLSYKGSGGWGSRGVFLMIGKDGRAAAVGVPGGTGRAGDFPWETERVGDCVGVHVGPFRGGSCRGSMSSVSSCFIAGTFGECVARNLST